MFPLQPPFGLLPDSSFNGVFPLWNPFLMPRNLSFPPFTHRLPILNSVNQTKDVLGSTIAGLNCNEKPLVFQSSESDAEPLSLQPGLLRIQLSFGEKKLSTVLCIDEHGFLPETSLELSPGWRSQCRVDPKLANCDGLKVLTKIECGQEIILSSRNPSRTQSPLNLTDHKPKTLNFSISNLSRSDDEILSESPPEVPSFEDVIAADGKGFECPRCGKVFSYEYYRDKHLKYTRCVDQGDRKFPCKSCSRSFEKRDRLRIHVLHVHENHRPHVCLVCGKAFSQSSSLNKHLRVHSGERPYKCAFCPKAFTASSILRTHIRQHSGEKPFKCAQCGKAFASHAAHDSHVRRTHGELKNDDIFG